MAPDIIRTANTSSHNFPLLMPPSVFFKKMHYIVYFSFLSTLTFTLSLRQRQQQQQQLRMIYKQKKVKRQKNRDLKMTITATILKQNRKIKNEKKLSSMEWILWCLRCVDEITMLNTFRIFFQFSYYFSIIGLLISAVNIVCPVACLFVVKKQQKQKHRFIHIYKY